MASAMPCSETRSDRWNGQTWSRFGAFFQDVYGSHIVETHAVGGCEAELLVADQSEGDCSNAATPALVIATLIGPTVDGDFNIGAGRFRPKMRNNDFIVIPPCVESQIVMHDQHRIEAIAIPYGKLVALAGDYCALPADGCFGHLHLRTNANPAVVSLRSALMRGARGRELHGDLAADGRILQLAAELLQMRDRQPARAVGGLSPTQLRRCLEALTQEAPHRPGLADLAKLTGLSASHVSRAFKVSTGATPHAWATRHSLERAKKALKSLEPIAQIAADCGFSSQQHFTTAFKKYTSVTPAMWRREQRL